MTGNGREPYKRADSDASDLSVASSRVSRGDESQIVERVKHAIVLCKQWSTTPWLKTRTDNDRAERLQDIEFTNMPPSSSPSMTPPQPRRLRDKPHPLLLDQTILPEDSSAFYNDEAIDPFITSPSWLKIEHTVDETRIQDRET